jgi:PAS domain S-box-containing protein
METSDTPQPGAVERQLLRTTLDTIGEGILVVDNENRILDYNAQFLAMWRIPQSLADTRDDQQLLGFAVTQLRDPAAFLKKVQDLYQSRERSHDMISLTDGRVFERYSSPLLENDALLGRLWSFRDVSAAHRAEEQVKASEQKYRSLFNEAVDMIHLVSSDGIILDANPAELRKMGYARSEYIGSSLLEHIHPDHREATRVAGQQVWNEGLSVTGFQTVMVNKTGEEIVVEVNVTPYLEEGRVQYARAIIRDVTDRHSAEAELIRYREHLEDLVTSRTARINDQARVIDQLHDAVVVLDLQQKIRLWNQGAERTFGYTAEEVLGRSMAFLVPEEDQSDLKNEIFKPLMQRGVLEQKARRVRKDGTVIPVHLSLCLQRDDSGEPTGIIGYVTDITEAQKKEDEIREAKEEAERASSAKSEFLSRMSHELRTPLNAILILAQLMASDDQDPLSDDHQASTEEMLFAAEHLLSLIKDVLDLETIETGGVELQFDSVPLRNSVQQCLSLSQPQAAKRGIMLVDEVPDLTVRADPTRLAQIILNLVSNGVKYNREGGRVTLTADRKDQRVTLRVSDTGVGLSSEQLDLVFLPFERAGAERSGVEGTGIGLTIAKRLTEMMGGVLSAQSAPEEGTTFMVELSAADPDPAKRSVPRGRSRKRSAPRPARVLLVEDNDVNVLVLQKILKRRPEIVLFTEPDGQRGLERARELLPDLILLDIGLPVMDGFEVMRRLKSSTGTRSIPVIAVTANAMPEDVRRGFEAGFTEYLSKPLQVADFLETIDRVLEELKSD